MEWKEVRLGEVADVQTGPFGSQLHKENYVNKGTPIVTVEHLGNKWFTSQNLPMVSDEDKLRLAKYCSQEGDVIFSRVGSVDRCSFVSKEYSGWLFSGRCLRVRPRSGINPEYLYYFLTNEGTKQYIRNIAVGATMPSINTKLLNEVPITIPSLADQRRIASILSSLDRKIELNNKINADLEEMAQAIFKNWFIDFEPFKDGKFVDSELGMIPEGWKVVKMGDFFPVKTGKKDANTASVNGKYPFFSCSQNALCTDSYSFDCDAILVAGNGDFNVKWYSGKFDAYQRTYVLIPYNKKLLALLYYVVKRNLLTITSKARGSVIRFITKGNLTDFEFAIPRDLENNEIVDVFESINEKIFANNKENSRLSLLRDTLLPRLMSGELEVPE